MELTRFEMENQAIERRKADALERIAQRLEHIFPVIDMLPAKLEALIVAVAKKD